MRVIIKEPEKKPYIEDVPNELKDLQRIVGGYIEVACRNSDGTVIICNEEGKLLNLPFNFFLLNHNRQSIDSIYGTVIVADTSEEEFTGLTDEKAERLLKTLWRHG